MTKTIQNEYHPDYVSPPGETLLETLETIGMSQAELAKRTGRPLKTINEIIQGKAAITPETALQLEQVLHIPASFWLKREQHYREALARLAEEEHLKNWVDWLKELPIKEMTQRGWLPACKEKTRQVLEALKFFGVASPDAWRVMWDHSSVTYRKSSVLTSNFGAVTAWLRQGELEAQEIVCTPYNADTFRTALISIRGLTIEPLAVSSKQLVHVCAGAGVAVTFVQELPKTGICGATRWLSPTKALIQLSLRYKTDDQLWFTFFHEAGHILLHGKRQVFLEIERQDSAADEQEANLFAANMLISPGEWQRFIEHGSHHTKAGIQEFAQRIGIAPGIIVGRLQHEHYLPFDHCNDLKRRLDWKSEEV